MFYRQATSVFARFPVSDVDQNGFGVGKSILSRIFGDRVGLCSLSRGSLRQGGIRRLL